MTKVIDLASARKEKEKEEFVEKTLSFEEIMERNKKNEERLRKERNQANGGVLKNYKIKS